MNELMEIGGIKCFEKDGVAYLELEAVARGLGFTTVATNGNEYVRWNRIGEYLKDFGFLPQVAKGSSVHGEDVNPLDFVSSVSESKAGLPKFIPENIFYRLAMKAKNAMAERFQAKVC